MTDSLGAVTSTLAQNIVTVTTPPVVATTADEWRFLNQATFGASQAEAAHLQSLGGITAWINDQFTQPMSGYPDAKYSHIQLKATVDCTHERSRTTRRTRRIRRRRSVRATI